MPSEDFRVIAEYKKVADSFSQDASVSVGSDGKKGFGASALCVRDKIFAMVSSKGAFVLKLPKTLVDELIAAKKGVRFEPSPGRIMKEWIEMDRSTVGSWHKLSLQAKQYVESKK